MECFELALKSQPSCYFPITSCRSNADAYFNKGATLLCMGQHSEANVWFKSALEVIPDVVTQFDLLLKKLPADVNTLLNKGNALFHLGHYQDALECFDTAALQLRSDDPPAVIIHFCKGVTLDAMGHHQSEAVRCFQMVYDIQPDILGKEKISLLFSAVPGPTAPTAPAPTQIPAQTQIPAPAPALAAAPAAAPAPTPPVLTVVKLTFRNNITLLFFFFLSFTNTHHLINFFLSFFLSSFFSNFFIH
eukprot:TRINITY_DN713_c0_g1_i3.p1 TRINITY_DN713_c0_g1~~TRINITY_DN713_c0_g1_i3.p1  ORF type:complete len:261 (+),score=66.83 TRINITY_DN713_c0_g1_i3:43-783(+)